MCIAHDATVCVMAMEAWMKTATQGEKFDMTEPPSEAFDRQEVVVLMGEPEGRDALGGSAGAERGIGNILGEAVSHGGLAPGCKPTGRQV